jgi:hypothetical protein
MRIRIQQERLISSNCNENYTGQFKKKVTFSHVYNEVTSESTAGVSVLPFYLKTEEDPASETL